MKYLVRLPKVFFS